METIVSKIIFNTLSSREGITLPGFGSLWVEYVSAKISGAGNICPPANRIGFSPEIKDDMDSIIKKMGDAGMDRETAENTYIGWLEKSKTLQGINIEGVGEVRDDLFIPSDELSALLNPRTDTGNAKPAGSKGLSKAEKNWIILIVLFSLILIVGWGWWMKNNKDTPDDKNINTAVVQKSATSTTLPSAETLPTGTGTDNPGSINETATEAQPETTEAANTEKPATNASATYYYVVGGVFSTQENADKFIKEMGDKYSGLDYRKHDFKGGKTMVSLFGSTDNNETQKKRRELADLTGQPDLWVHKLQ